MDLAWYFSEIEPNLLREIVQNVHGGVLPNFPSLGRLNPLYVVRNSHISEDINIMMARHERRFDFLLSEASHPGDKSDLSGARELARRHMIEGRKLDSKNSEYPEKADKYVSDLGDRTLRGLIQDDYELYELMVAAQQTRKLPLN